MGFYNNYILPKITESVCSAKPFVYQRKKIVPRAQGRVLEIGLGSGLNLPFYDSRNVDLIWGLEPSLKMRKLAGKRVLKSPVPVDFLDLISDQIPLDSDSADTVLVTYTLCTIQDIEQSLADMKRVLKPGGELIFCEHGRAPDSDIRKWQDRLNPLWKTVTGGCHLNRAIPDLIKNSGFHINRLETIYIPGWKPACFNYWGSASPG